MPALRMGDRDPPQHFREFALASRPEQEVPVVRHQAIGGEADAESVMRLRENPLERSIVGRFLKQQEAPHAPVEHMIGEVSSSEAWAARHGRGCTALARGVSRKDSRPLFLA